MKLILIMCDTEDLLRVRELIEKSEVCGYTEIPNLHGAGIFGKKLDTRAFPGTSCVIFASIKDDWSLDIFYFKYRHKAQYFERFSVSSDGKLAFR